MEPITDSIDEIIEATERLRKYLRKKHSKQVTSLEERSTIKAVALMWFNTTREKINAHSFDVIEEANDGFRILLDCSGRSTTRARYYTHLAYLKRVLLALRSVIVIPQSTSGVSMQSPPDFDPLVADADMREILRRRWHETHTCLTNEAHLAATVMMGALLEALLLARVNRMSDKSPLFRLACSPKNRNTGKAKDLRDWTLHDYLNVAHEIGWIAKSAKEVGSVLRDYRNYIHPAKELAEGVNLGKADTQIFWAILTEIAGQIVKST